MALLAGVTPLAFGGVGVTLRSMPTTKPRIFLTLGEKDEAALAKLCAAWGLPPPKAIRKALRLAAEKVEPPK